MKTSMIMSLVLAATLFAPVAANAGEGAGKSLHGRHVAHRHKDLANATALYMPAPPLAAAPASDPRSTGGSKGVWHQGNAGFGWEPHGW